MIRIFTLSYMRSLGLAAALAITVLLTAPVSAGELRLIPRIVVDGDMVTLGDLFGDIGDAGETIAASAPVILQICASTWPWREPRSPASTSNSRLE